MTAKSPEQEMPFEDEEGEAAVAWEDLPPEREFFATAYDPPVKTLVDEIRDGELLVRPSFQRNAVWDPVRQSKFIESILLNIPIPTLFFAEDESCKVVVDGQQRLNAMKEYLENRYELKGLEVLAALRGKRFEDLSEKQQRILRNRTIRCLVISAKSDSEIRFQVFERLNTGGMPLNAQEVRHCVYRGELNDLLHTLASNDVWLKLIGRKKAHPRMNDCELILRFFAIRNALPNYTPPLKTLLNDFMRDHRHPDQAELLGLRAAFEAAIGPVSKAFGGGAFRRVFLDKDGTQLMDRGVNRAVFDAQMLVMEGINPQWATNNSDAINAAFLQLCTTDQPFVDALSRATADKVRLETRLREWKDALVGLGAVLPSLPRLP
jgi:hypothetical protein